MECHRQMANTSRAGKSKRHADLSLMIQVLEFVYFDLASCNRLARHLLQFMSVYNHLFQSEGSGGEHKDMTDCRD